MNKKRVLWLSNVDLLDEKVSHSGTWIYSMYNAISHSNDVEICANITFTSKKDFFSKSFNDTKHYYVPRKLVNRNGYPSDKAIEFIVKSINECAPDILHVWGTEFFWGLIVEDKRLAKYKKILEIQGIKLLWAEKPFFYGGLDRDDLLKTRGFARWLMPSYRIESLRHRYAEWGIVEKRMFSNFDCINTQSEWVRRVMSFLAKDADIRNTGIILRDCFINSKPWYLVHKENDAPVIFTTSSPTTWKGFHITMRAFCLIRDYFPNAKLKVAGISEWKPTILNRIRGGYGKFLYSLEKEMHLEGAIEYLGKLTEEQILVNMYSADVFVISSFIESYCLALAEALSIGVPSVSSYTSALPELIKNDETGLLYPIGDYFICANMIIRILENKELSMRLSMNSSSSYREKNNPMKIVKQQIETYLEML